MSESPDDGVGKLHKGQGVRRGDLFQVLSPELRRTWHLAGRSVEVVRAHLVSWIRDIVESNFADDYLALLARAAYNVDWGLDLHGLNLLQRQELAARAARGKTGHHGPNNLFRPKI